MRGICIKGNPKPQSGFFACQSTHFIDIYTLFVNKIYYPTTKHRHILPTTTHSSSDINKKKTKNTCEIPTDITIRFQKCRTL